MLSLAAIGVLMACLLLVGTSVLFSLNINRMVGYLQTQNEVVIFLKDDLEGSDLTAFDKRLRSFDNVASVKFISREEGLREWMADLGDDGTLLDWLVQDNPLQNSYRLVVADPSRMEETVQAIGALDGVESINASFAVAQTVTGLKQAVTAVSLAVCGILGVVSLMIVANTIRITVFNRRREIGIMKYVGATDAFIRLPFLSEGVLLGLFSATFAFILLWVGYVLMADWLAASTLSWAKLFIQNIIPFEEIAPRLYLYFVAAGVGIGGLGSVVFTGKYLKV
jgi:cell division transport system permease protein